MNGIEDRVTSLLTWGLPPGRAGLRQPCAGMVRCAGWILARLLGGAAAVLVVAGLAARLWRSFRTRGK